jgi:chromosome segregation ATPase
MAKEKMNILDNMEYQEVLRVNIANLKAELQELQRQVANSSVEVAQNKDMLLRDKREFDTIKARELKKTEIEKQTILNSIVAQKEGLKQGEASLVRRSTDLQSRELAVMKLEEERKKVLDSRIEIQRLLGTAKSELQRATLEKANSQSALAEIDSREKEIKKAIEDIKLRETELASRENTISKLTKDTDAKLTNVLEIQKNIEPNLKALKETEDNNRKILDEIKQKEQSVNGKLEQDRSLIAEIQNREIKLRQKEIEVNSKLEEATRRLLFADKAER